MKPAVVLWTLNDAPFYQAVRQMGISVGADAVGGKERSLFVADQGVAFAAMVEAQDIGRSKVSRSADFDPTLGIRFDICAFDLLDRTLPGRGQFAFHVVRGLRYLTEHSRQNLTPGGENRRVGRRTIVLHKLVQLRKVVVRHQREHVVLEVVVHVPVHEPAERIHEHRAAVQSVIQDVFRQSCMLGRIMDDHEPSPKKMRQDDQKNRNPRMQHNG